MSEEFDVIYVLNIKDPAAHLYEITCIVNNPDPSGQIFSLPAWIPGSYMIRDFAKNIVQIRASGGPHPLKLEKIDKQTWRCEASEESLTIIYEVYAWDLSVRTAHLDQTHAYFNGSSLFIRLHGKDHMPCLVDLLKPFMPGYDDWQVATSLPRAGADAWSFGTYRTENYDELIDHPVEIGTFQKGSFEVAGVKHDIVFTGVCRPDIERICNDLSKVCHQHIAMFDEPPPFERYLFQVMVVGNGYGGLEHSTSTSLLCSRKDLPLLGDEGISDEYRNFLGLCSHEYFHAWNVKRIKPAAFIPFDLSKEVHTKLLWWFEGVTSYYDDLAVVRSGLINREDYLQIVGQNITRVMSGSGRLKQSIAESSYDAWTKFYKQDENAPNAVVSYYVKGSLLALCLDLTIRRQTNHAKSLDDVMRLLWQEYGKKNIGVPENAMAEIVHEATGVDVAGFLEQYLEGTEDLPLAAMLKEFGIEQHLRVAENMTDKGGLAKEASQLPRVSLGARTSSAMEGARVDVVFDGSDAQRCGLAAGDIIIALDGIKTGQDNLEKLIRTYVPGQKASLHVFRRDELMNFECEFSTPAVTTCYLTLDEQTPKAVLNSWLTGV